ncbi:Type I restriction enzyme R protein N terminus (HSDR_N) [Arthrobacter alpinus]|uniref:Type I restriction enzyme R protein N terminus (HSDR_N) n=2 Tax=Arthrobacter alpinus TaxID=656366 RepID=A0A1H5N2B2_9MICC|nr:Type I restriction enzyme R protein N terminus (HSDR_N) [Arthrobacter alpinus]
MAAASMANGGAIMTEISLDAKGQIRLDILTQWALEAEVAGHPVPERVDLQVIAHTKIVAIEGAGAALVQLWEPTISWMLKQAGFGVIDPFRHLPEELLKPVGHATLPAAVVPVELAPAAVVSDSVPGGKAPNAAPAAKTPKWETAAREQVRDAIKRYMKPLEALRARDANEGDTRLVVTDILCEGLDYDKFRDLTTEYMVRQDFADYGVRIDKQLVAFIEVKRISQKLNERHLRQVQMYAVNEGIEWMVLTNGSVWQAYHLTGGLPVIVNMAFEIDLLGPASLEEKSELMFLLHREALKRRRIDESWKHRAATEPKALLELILSEVMLEQIRKEVKRRTGITTTQEALGEVIRTEIVDPKLIAKIYKS